jgi:hypothetical protein
MQTETEFLQHLKDNLNIGRPTSDIKTLINQRIIKIRQNEALIIDGVSPMLPIKRYHLTLKSLASKIDGIKNADSINEREWHLQLAQKIIREEMYLYPIVKGN